MQRHCCRQEVVISGKRNQLSRKFKELEGSTCVLVLVCASIYLVAKEIDSG